MSIHPFEIPDQKSCMHNLQDNIDAKVIVAGLSTTCSQKIHNQLVCKVILLFWRETTAFKLPFVCAFDFLYFSLL